MSAWSNIEISFQDPEILRIDQIEKDLGQLPAQIQQVRELITRFEVCHFKTKQHYKNIKNSIDTLQPSIDPCRIGENHIHKGEDAWQKDGTGRSQVGQQYLRALKGWLSENSQGEKQDERLGLQVAKWLGDKLPEKEKLVRLLIARLTWDWQSLGELQKGGEFEQIENQVCRMDICHYAFPKHLDHLIQGIGSMQPVEDFNGCGTYEPSIKVFLNEELAKLCDWLKTNVQKNHTTEDKEKLTQIWLFACLAKTVKEQLGFIETLPLG